jgi:hypothetical protein
LRGGRGSEVKEDRSQKIEVTSIFHPKTKLTIKCLTKKMTKLEFEYFNHKFTSLQLKTI